MSRETFSRRTLVILVSLCGLSLITGVTIGIFNEEIGSIKSANNDTYSFSAIGHHGFKTLLEEFEFPVLVSRSNSGQKTGNWGTLILSEPDLETASRSRKEKFWEMLDTAGTILVVLPKRSGTPSPRNPDHLESVSLVSTAHARSIMDLLEVESSVFRSGHTRDMNWDKGAWKDRPFINQVQLMTGDNIAPLIASDEGILLGELQVPENREDSYLYVCEVLVLSDPDLLANHGLKLGHNAAISLKMMEYLHQGYGTVVFDETLHGYEVSPSVARSFFRIPLIFVLMQVLITAGAFLWMANGRFGSVRPLTVKENRGVDFLINNTADLLEFGGHGPFVLGRYYRSTISTICRRLHLDLPQSSDHARKRLINISQVRSKSYKFTENEAKVPAVALDSAAKRQEILALARAIHRWQQEMTHGL